MSERFLGLPESLEPVQYSLQHNMGGGSQRFDGSAQGPSCAVVCTPTDSLFDSASRCRHWPFCFYGFGSGAGPGPGAVLAQRGPQCRFWHPISLCMMYPHCNSGDDACYNIHPKYFPLIGHLNSNLGHIEADVESVIAKLPMELRYKLQNQAATALIDLISKRMDEERSDMARCRLIQEKALLESTALFDYLRIPGAAAAAAAAAAATAAASSTSSGISSLTGSAGYAARSGSNFGLQQHNSAVRQNPFASSAATLGAKAPTSGFGGGGGAALNSGPTTVAGGFNTTGTAAGTLQSSSTVKMSNSGVGGGAGNVSLAHHSGNAVLQANEHQRSNLQQTLSQGGGIPQQSQVREGTMVITNLQCKFGFKCTRKGCPYVHPQTSERFHALTDESLIEKVLPTGQGWSTESGPDWIEFDDLDMYSEQLLK